MDAETRPLENSARADWPSPKRRTRKHLENTDGARHLPLNREVLVFSSGINPQPPLLRTANSTVFVFFGTPLAPQSRCWLRYLSAQHYTHPKQGVPFWSMPDQSKTVNKKAFPRRCAHRTDTLDVATRFLVLPHTGPPRVCCGAAVVPIPIADLFCSDRRLRRAGTGCVERVPFA